MRRFTFFLLILAVLAVLGAGAAYATGEFGSQSESVEIRVGNEPIQVLLAGSSKFPMDEGISYQANLEPGEEIRMRYEVRNTSAGVDYVVELVPVAQGNAVLSKKVVL